MKKFLKILKWTGIVLVILIAGLYIFVQAAGNKKFDAPYPGIQASSDSAVIARGKYLAYGPAHCATCHVPMDKIMDVENGVVMPLSGGWEESVPGFGTFRAPNLTPDLETGIGKRTDAELARSIRYMVNHEGRILFPFMASQGMSDEDLTAVISFLRSQDPVSHQIEPTKPGFLAKALVAFGLFKPEGPKETPPKFITADSTAAYGRYLAYSIGNCKGCHTEIDMNTGAFIGKDFSGKGVFPPNAFSKGYSFVSPNLTPHPATGVMVNWSEQDYIERFKVGRLHEGTPMPWGAFSRMNEMDMKALYRFFNSIEPVENQIIKTVYAPGEKIKE
jgi:mono/diheme cytochrome c family protein